MGPGTQGTGADSPTARPLLAPLLALLPLLPFAWLVPGGGEGEAVPHSRCAPRQRPAGGAVAAHRVHVVVPAQVKGVPAAAAAAAGARQILGHHACRQAGGAAGAGAAAKSASAAV